MTTETIDDLSPGNFETVKFKGDLVRPKLTFFYEKDDGLVFACEEPEASTGKYNKIFKFVGWSTGETYFKTIQAAKLKRNQIVSKEVAETLLQDAFDAELKVAKKNLKDAKKNGTRIPRPQRTEWFFDSSVPENDRFDLAKGNYGQLKL